MKLQILITLILISQLPNSFSQTTTKDKNDGLLEYNASLGGKSGGTITKEEILNAKTLLLDKEINSVYHIISFKLTLICKDRDIREYENPKNGELNSLMIEGLKNSESGCKLYFEYIKVTDRSNLIDSIRHVRPLEFVIKF